MTSIFGIGKWWSSPVPPEETETYLKSEEEELIAEFRENTGFKANPSSKEIDDWSINMLPRYVSKLDILTGSQEEHEFWLYCMLCLPINGLGSWAVRGLGLLINNRKFTHSESIISALEQVAYPLAEEDGSIIQGNPYEIKICRSEEILPEIIKRGSRIRKLLEGNTSASGEIDPDLEDFSSQQEESGITPQDAEYMSYWREIHNAYSQLNGLSVYQKNPYIDSLFLISIVLLRLISKSPTSVHKAVVNRVPEATPNIITDGSNIRMNLSLSQIETIAKAFKSKSTAANDALIYLILYELKFIAATDETTKLNSILSYGIGNHLTWASLTLPGLIEQAKESTGLSLGELAQKLICDRTIESLLRYHHFWNDIVLNQNNDISYVYAKLFNQDCLTYLSLARNSVLTNFLCWCIAEPSNEQENVWNLKLPTVSDNINAIAQMVGRRLRKDAGNTIKMGSDIINECKHANPVPQLRYDQSTSGGRINLNQQTTSRNINISSLSPMSSSEVYNDPQSLGPDDFS